MSEIFGLHAVDAALSAAPERIRVLYVQKGGREARKQTLIDKARAAGVRVEFVERRWLDSRVQGAHQGVVAESQALALADEKTLEARWAELPRPRLVLALDGIQDPRNLGACLRSAGAAGVQIVLLPKRNSAPLSPAALKTAAGVAESLFIVAVSNLSRRLEWFKEQGAWIIGAAGDAPRRYFDADFTADTVLVVGGEEKGLRRLTREHCDHLVGIPMAGGVESLNVSVAAGVLLFEVVRQRAR
ncbi:MAG TPA: 23S rRNA (guanosine(2251)-2'-O)-methyltransferase RlmB [Pseudomonadales bacterium]